MHPRLATVQHSDDQEEPIASVVRVQFVRAEDGRPKMITLDESQRTKARAGKAGALPAEPVLIDKIRSIGQYSLMRISKCASRTKPRLLK